MAVQDNRVSEVAGSSIDALPVKGLSKNAVSKNGLRQRQKAERRELILKVALEYFELYGFEKTKIEAIADDVGMSAVTIFNYFNSKAGLLLSLVEESDARLIDRLQAHSNSDHKNANEAIVNFAKIIHENATGFLTKALWKQVLAANIIDKGRDFRWQYRILESELKTQLLYLLKRLNKQDKLPKMISVEQISETIFTLLMARFLQYISSEKLLSKDINALFEADVNLILR